MRLIMGTTCLPFFRRPVLVSKYDREGDPTNDGVARSKLEGLHHGEEELGYGTTVLFSSGKIPF